MTRPSALAVALILAAAPSVVAQTPPAPGPEHEVLKKLAGTWDAALEMVFGPGSPPVTLSGVETDTLFAGRWIHTEFKSDMMGQPYEGHGLVGWDPEKKVYVTVWADTMLPGMLRSEGTWDKATSTMTAFTEAPGPAGGTVRVKSVTTWPADGERVVKSYMPADAPEPYMTITYTLRK